MPTPEMEYVLEAASGAHFSGLRYVLLQSSESEENKPKQPFVIGVSGGTASGKTTVCDMIIQQLHDHRVVLVNQDQMKKITLKPHKLHLRSNFYHKQILQRHFQGPE